MLYLTLKDDPFAGQQHGEADLFELVRSVARRDADDRTVSELRMFQDSLDRLGLLWTPFDCLDARQTSELVRNLHLELAAPGDMIYLKHSPAMRSYVVLRGTILLCNNVLDREEAEGTRVLAPGDEFGAPLDPDPDLDRPVPGFQEYAKNPPLDVHHDSGGRSDAPSSAHSVRKDRKAELLVIGRQEWNVSTTLSSANFAEIIAKDMASKDPDPLKASARVVFNLMAKGRKEEHLAIARQYLLERVPFCLDLPEAQVSVMAAGLELCGLHFAGRVIFRGGRECYGEAYIMFTGTADLVGGDPSGDRLIKEGDLFGDDHFGSRAQGVDVSPFRINTAISRTSPCELLVLPARECRRLQAFVAARNSEKATVVFEKFFHNIPKETLSELSSLVTFRKVIMHENLASQGDDVTTVFFVFRGECITREPTQDGKVKEQRYGPGHIVGWPFLMPKGQGSTKPPNHPSVSTDAAVTPKTAPQAVKRRPRRTGEEWRDTVKVTTPAQVLSVPIRLLAILSVGALQGLRAYISLTHGLSSEEDTTVTNPLTQPGGFSKGGADGRDRVRGFDVSSYFGNEGGSARCTGGKIKVAADWRRSSTASGTTENVLVRSVLHDRRSRTPSVTLEELLDLNPRQLLPRPKCRPRWRWREDIRAINRMSSAATQRPSVRSASRRSAALRGCGCCCPVNRCRVCSSSRRLERFNRTQAWVPSLLRPTAAPATPAAARPVDRPLTSPAARVSTVCATPTVLHDAKDTSYGEVIEGSLMVCDACHDGAQRDDALTSLDGTSSTEPSAGDDIYLVAGDKGTDPSISNHSVSSLDVNTYGENDRDDGVPRRQSATPGTQRGEPGVYTLMQLSTRTGLDPSEPLAALFLRVLGSFHSDVEATTRVLNLYRSVLREDSGCWHPYQGSAGTHEDEFAVFSDHFFLLRKGVPVRRLSCNAGAQGTVNQPGRSTEVGRGYDAGIPAVFKTKAQLFAIALVPSADRITQEWEHRQQLADRREQEGRREDERRAAEEAFAVAASTKTTEDRELSSESEVSSSLRSGEHDVPGQPDANMRLAFGRNLGQDGPENSGESRDDANDAEGEPAPTIVEGDSPAPVAVGGETVEYVTDQATSKEISHSSRQAEVHCEQRGSLSNLEDGTSAGGLGAVQTLSEMLSGSSLDEWLDKSDTESSRDGRKRRGREAGGGDPLDGRHYENEPCSEGGRGEKAAIVHWIVSRMGLVEKVEGCYETEASAFRKAVEINDEMETSAAGANIPLASVPQEPPHLPRPHRSSQACVFPLYQWISLGDGRFCGVEAAISYHSVADPSRARQAGVDPFLVWTDQRSRKLRTNLFNMLTAAGPTEIRNRCGLPVEGGALGGSRRGEIRPLERSANREDSAESSVDYRKTVIFRRTKRAKESVRAAREAVLKQHDNLFQAERDVRRRFSGTASPTGGAGPKNTGGDLGNTLKPKANETAAVTPEKQGVAIDSTLVGGVGTWFGTADRGYGGAQHKLRAQMGIERKRARLFEDLQKLPYIGTKRGTKGANRGRGTSNSRLGDPGQTQARSPPIPQRAATVQAQRRLHGKPSASFFARVHAAGVTADEKGPLDEEPTFPRTATAPATESATLAVDKSILRAKAKAPLALSSPKANDVSVYENSNASTSEQDTTGEISFGEGVMESRSGEVGAVGAVASPESRGKSAAHQKRRYAATKRKERPGVKGGDGFSSSTIPAVCSLDGELVLLDGVLHDAGVRTWVEASLGPPAGNR